MAIVSIKGVKKEVNLDGFKIAGTAQNAASNTGLLNLNSDYVQNGNLEINSFTDKFGNEAYTVSSNGQIIGFTNESQIDSFNLNDNSSLPNYAGNYSPSNQIEEVKSVGDVPENVLQNETQNNSVSGMEIENIEATEETEVLSESVNAETQVSDSQVIENVAGIEINGETGEIVDASNGRAVADFASQYEGLARAEGAGANDLTKGVDCSGFVQAVYKQFGVDLPHSSSSQAQGGTHINNVEDLQPGDVVAWNTDGSGNNVTHVGIYVGNGNMIQSGNGGVKTVSLAEYSTYPSKDSSWHYKFLGGSRYF